MMFGDAAPANRSGGSWLGRTRPVSQRDQRTGLAMKYVARAAPSSTLREVPLPIGVRMAGASPRIRVRRWSGRYELRFGLWGVANRTPN